MKGYKEIAEVDWVQLRVPRSVKQMKRARDAVDGPFSIMQAYIRGPLLSNEGLLNLGISLPRMPRPTHDVTYVPLDDFIKDSME